MDVPLEAPRHDAGCERLPVEQEAQRGELGGAVLGRRHGRAHVVLDALGHREERVGGALGGALPCRGPGQPPKQEGRAAVGEVGPPQAQLQGPLARLEDARPGRLPEEQGQVLGAALEPHRRAQRPDGLGGRRPQRKGDLRLCASGGLHPQDVGEAGRVRHPRRLF